MQATESAEQLDGYTTPHAVARQLAVSVKLIYKLAASGELESVKVGRSVRILTASVRAFIERNTVRVEEPPAPLPQPPVTPSPRLQRKPDRSGFVFLPPRS